MAAMKPMWSWCLLLAACRQVARTPARPPEPAPAPPPVAAAPRFHFPALEPDDRAGAPRAPAYRVRAGLWLTEQGGELQLWDGAQLIDVGRGQTVPVPSLGRVIQREDGVHEVDPERPALRAVLAEQHLRVLGDWNGALVVSGGGDLAALRPGQPPARRHYDLLGMAPTGPDGIRDDRLLVVGQIPPTPEGDEPHLVASIAYVDLRDGRLTPLGHAMACFRPASRQKPINIWAAYRTSAEVDVVWGERPARFEPCRNYVDPAFTKP